MKLVKPPEKKTPVGPNTKPVNKNKPVVETKPAQKANMDILDLDFNAVAVSETPVASSVEPLEFLGGNTAPQSTKNNNADLFQS